MFEGDVEAYMKRIMAQAETETDAKSRFHCYCAEVGNASRTA